MRSRLPCLTLLGALVTTGCGHAAVAGQAAKSVKVLPPTTVPATIGGLDVQVESVKAAIAKKGAELTYADALGFWSLRKDKLVQATLQIEHLGPSARLSDPKFIASIAQGVTMGATSPTRIGDYDVYLQQGQTVNLAVWFQGPYFFELAVRPTYAQPRTLLESAVAVKA